jgi:FKBP-type peptidyl-prolyl cis-trans isomerase 2
VFHRVGFFLRLRSRRNRNIHADRWLRVPDASLVGESLLATAQLGDRVRVELSRSSKTKPASRDKRPGTKVLEFIVGSRDVMQGLSSGVVGMALGERKHLTLQPSEAYGPVRPGLVKEIPRHQIPKHLILRVGKRLIAKSATTSRRRSVRIVEINTKSVLVDGNHRLAGKIVELEITLVSLSSSAPATGSAPQLNARTQS